MARFSSFQFVLFMVEIESSWSSSSISHMYTVGGIDPTLHLLDTRCIYSSCFNLEDSFQDGLEWNWPPSHPLSGFISNFSVPAYLPLSGFHHCCA